MFTITPELKQNYKNYNKHKITVFKLHNLYKIQYTQNLYPESLKNSEGALFSEFVCSVKVLKYNNGDKIRVTMADMGKLLKAHGAPHHSSSTVRRCLARLEQLGYITIERRRDGLLISLNLDRFAYWTRQTSSNITPTSVHISHPLSNWQDSDRSKNNLRVNSCNSSSYPTRAKQDKFIFWKHPIVYTLMMVLKGDPDRVSLLARAEIETRAIAAGVELLHPSGVPWEHYAKHWQELDPNSGGPRELIAKNEILPILRRSVGCSVSNVPDRTNRPESKFDEMHDTDGEDRTIEELSEIKRLISEFTAKKSVEPNEPNNIRSNTPESNNLTAEELSICVRERDRCRIRALVYDP